MAAQHAQGPSLAARILAQRETWCDLPEATPGQPARGLLLRRPAETDFGRFAGLHGPDRSRRIVDLVCDHAVAWRGFTEATFLGDAVGASDPLDFDLEVLRLRLADNVAELEACLAHLSAQVQSYLEQREGLRKNSMPSSTPSKASTAGRASPKKPNPRS
ncbi:UNVERIFIED_ORG: hypothetical protein LHJ69_12895 [Shinella sp. XGS7]|nr:hypothetical protein [Shinella sp. XGS7]